MLTLPAKDGLRDGTTVRVLSGRSGPVDLDTVRGTRTVHLGRRLALRSTRIGWGRSVRVDVRHLTAGTWRLIAQRSTDHGVQARSRALPVGTGAAVHVGVRPAVRVLYPFRDSTLDTALVTITAKDETNTLVPVTGSVRIDAGAQHVTRPLGSTGAVQLPITSLPLGPATVTAEVIGPSTGEAVRRTGLTLAPTGVGVARIARSSSTVPYAVRDLFTVGSGNQQGLAVRNNRFSVGYDIGNDLSKIDVYDGAGLLLSSLGPLPIPHITELAYSTATDRIYAATGGARTPTKVFVLDPTDPQWGMNPPTDPSAVIRDTYDFTSTLGNNAMVAVDDVSRRLLVFSGETGHFSITSVTMTPSAETDSAGEPVVKAGTITGTADIRITGVPQGMDLVGQQLWIYTSDHHLGGTARKVNLVEKYDLAASALFSTSASTSSPLYWGGEGEGMATVAASDTGDGLPAWIYVGAHRAAVGGSNMLGRLVPVTDGD